MKVGKKNQKERITMKAKVIKQTKGLELNKVYSVDIYRGDFADIYDDKGKRIGTFHISRFDFDVRK
jgi:hypothetical protein